MFIDTHTHIYLDAFDQDRDAMIERARAAGVKACYLPAIDASVMPALLSLEDAYQGFCHAMTGLHPCSVKEDYLSELDMVKGWLHQRPFAALGEIGLDFHWDLTYADQQYRAFHQQVEWAKQFHLPVVLHSRKSTSECIDVIRQHQDGQLTGVFHCFSGTVDQAAAIIELGFYLGIGGVLTYKNGGLEPVIKTFGLEKIILETDAPYLSPVPHRGKRNEPAYIVHVAEALSRLTGATMEEVGRVTTANAETLFNG